MRIYDVMEGRESLWLPENVMNSRTCLLFVCLSLSLHSIAMSDILTTQFNANNGQSGNMFNIDVLAGDGIVVEAFDLNLDAGSWDLELYVITGGIYNGNETNASAWTLVDSVSGLTGAGFDNATFWDFNDLNLAAGNNAFYVSVTNGTAMNYTNGTSEGALLTGDANLQIFQGTGNVYPFGTQFRPRIWNGSIHYSTVPEPSTVFVLGLCCVLTLSHRRRSC